MLGRLKEMGDHPYGENLTENERLFNMICEDQHDERTEFLIKEILSEFISQCKERAPRKEFASSEIEDMMYTAIIKVLVRPNFDQDAEPIEFNEEEWMKKYRPKEYAEQLKAKETSRAQHIPSSSGGAQGERKKPPPIPPRRPKTKEPPPIPLRGPKHKH